MVNFNLKDNVEVELLFINSDSYIINLFSVDYIGRELLYITEVSDITLDPIEEIQNESILRNSKKKRKYKKIKF